MARPLRIEFPGALYHVTARGDRKRTIFFHDEDRLLWLDILGVVCRRANFVVHAYCQMGNHFHLMLETVDGNLSDGMRHMNAFYSQEINRRYGLVGHLFQGRYKAILVEKESYLLELVRYVVLNPVRGKLVDAPEDWHWSSYRSVLGKQLPPSWLDTDWVLSQFAHERDIALEKYQQFVMAGIGKESPLKQTQHQIMLGGEEFVEQHCQRLRDANLSAVVKDQRRLAVLKLEEYKSLHPDRTQAMAAAYNSTAFTMCEIARHFGVSRQTVSRAVQGSESQLRTSSGTDHS
jgi:putative transposase